MSDTSSLRSSVRASILLNRPQISPIGPRTRQSTIRVSTVNGNAGDRSSLVSEAAPVMSPSQLPLPLSRSNSTTPKPLPLAPSPVQTKPLPSPTIPNLQLPQTTGSPLPSFASLSSPRMDFGEFSGRNSGGRIGSPLARSSSSAGPSSPAVASQAPLPTLSEEAKTSHESEDEDDDLVPAYSHFQERDSAPALPPFAVEAVETPPKVSPVLQAHPKLVPPPPIKFETPPVSWKGMPLEAALWTFNSKELQEIVARAIRSSSQESFIRLLTVENLDNILPAEIERLEVEKTTIQSRYRFLVHRRAMLFQALNLSSNSQAKAEETGSISVVSKLTAQLAETITDCDQRLEELLRINDQIAQVNKLIDIHSASALAIALRKLNGSYSRRTKDLNTARDRIFQLEAELNDAWKEAEQVAQELDDYETALGADDTEAIIETAEIVPVPTSPSGSPPPSMTPHLKRRGSIPLPMTPTLLEVRALSSPSPTARTILLPQSGSASPAATTHFVFPPVTPDQEDKNNDNSDAVSIRSTKSNKSTRSTQGAKVLRTSSVQAAKKRSLRASQGSLRLNLALGHGRKPSGSSSRRTPFSEDAPPIPDLPIHFVNGAGVQSLKGGMSQEFGYSGPPSANASSTLLHFDGNTSLGHGRQISASTTGTTGSRLRPQEITVPNASTTVSQPLPSPVPTLRRQASMDTVCTVGKTTVAAIDAYRGKPVDDIYLRMGGQVIPRSTIAFSPTGPYSSSNVPTDIPWDDGDIQLVPRTPPYRSHTFSGRATVDHTLLPPRPPPKDPGKTIPSMWMNVDAVKAAPTARSASSPMATSTSLSNTSGSSPDSVSVSMAGSIPLSNNSGKSAAVSETPSALSRRSTTYDKLKGLTKRYSTSIPLFNPKVQKPGARRSG